MSKDEQWDSEKETWEEYSARTARARTRDRAHLQCDECGNTTFTLKEDGSDYFMECSKCGKAFC